MPPKKPKPSQPEPSKRQEQTLLFIKPKKVEEKPQPEPIPEEVIKAKSPPPKPVKRVLPPPDPNPLTTPINAPDTTVEAPPDAIFKAVGIISGTVTFGEQNATVFIGDNQYPLYYSSRHRKSYDALKKQVENNPGKLERLIVYPRVMHFPRRELLHIISFQLVGFDNSKSSEGITNLLQDFEFQLCGLWQFIPVCATPCISVFKNFHKQRLEYIKQQEAYKRVRYMKPSHIPLIWKDSPIRPFRFNPKLEREQQGHSSFVEVLARFIPGRDVFGFVEMLSTPAEKCPRFLKARKEDKMEALKTKVAFDREKDVLNSPKKAVWGKPIKAK